VRRSTLLVILLGCVTFLAGLGRPAIGDSDEAFYAEAGREMVASGDWLTPRYNYETRFQKPILYYWFVAATYAVAGVGEAQARFWAAVSGIGLALLTMTVGRRWFDETTALVGGAIVATSFGYFSIGRSALPDLPLAFFITLTILAAIAGTLDRDRHASRWLIAAGIGVGCAFLTKGPVGVIVPAIVLLPLWLLERHRLQIPGRGALAGGALAIAIGTPWYIAMAWTHGEAYFQGFFVGDNLERFATSRFNDPRPAWFYALVVLGGMLPWTPLLAVAAPLAHARLRSGRWFSPRLTRLAIWALVPLAFFTLSIGKQPRYILPILPPLALMLAAAIVARLDGAGRRERDGLLQIPAAIVAALLAALAVLLFRARAIVLMVPSVFIVAAIVALGVAALIAFIAAVGPRARAVPGAIALAAVLTLAGLQYGLSPAGRDPVQDMATLVLRHRTGEEPVATFRVFVRNLVFYTHIRQTDLPTEQHVVEFLRSPRRVLCVIGADELARVRRQLDVEAHTLGEVLYFNASAVKLRTLIDPDQTRDLERVLLVTNR
jgi:4-amino-4-deoxy-L-arabinose transferase-like glycosyltransferase